MQRFLSLTLACLLLLAACRGPDILTGEWQLQSYGALDNPIPAQAEANIVFKNGTVSGKAGCNTFSGQYRVTGNKVTFSNLASTLMACLGPGVMEQESAIMQGLHDAGQFSVKDNQLVIYHDQGKQVLVFQRVFEQR